MCPRCHLSILSWFQRSAIITRKYAILVQTHPFMTNIDRMKRSIREMASWLLGVFGSILAGRNNWTTIEKLMNPKKIRAIIWKKRKSKEKAKIKIPTKTVTIIKLFNGLIRTVLFALSIFTPSSIYSGSFSVRPIASLRHESRPKDVDFDQRLSQGLPECRPFFGRS